ncbi:TrmB family transcriptional regulator [Streptacidiphilus sp. ASG 303]|uniref:TrmB family transcriptional regulator n=1 Tax=Streptacidiphilus sp. ASG 303 TaxID=2896847 RepID=UPI001E3C9C9E|nr:helix-turn-helix domain-containing protein [Streptacidiphilus sp. ASG 303]MCD0484175.1 TrmB family transcriptional regulator [Streptacidiphilus sp. ASG 303]
MDADDGPVNDLIALGLSRYEARVYLALVRRESYTAAEAAREADVPRQRIYDVLDGLVRRRLAVARPGRVATFSAVAPELATARLMTLQRESLDRLERVSAALTAALLPVWSDGRTHTDPLDYIEVLREPGAIAERFADIQEQAGRELLSFCKPPFVAPAANTEGIAVVRRLHRAGGRVRAVYTHDALDDAETLDNVRSFAEAGEEARFTAGLPLKLVIADASLVLCDMPDPVAGTGATTALYIEHPALAACLRLAFESVWQCAEPAAGARAAR